LLAHFFKIKLATVFLQGLGQNPDVFFQVLDTILSGLIIGGGSQPLHVLIRFLTERKVSAAKETTQEPAAATTPVAETIMAASFKAEVAEVTKTPAQEWAWQDMVYLGGVNPASLETSHRRSGDPNLIVYHHTAMSSNAPFQEVVKEFLESKKWLTGYHCVIMPDGRIEAFCRWDRSGNHAKGLNDRSLGISFHGNFHTALNDRFSNADGRYGNQLPTEAQLHAGARVVALWVLLYPDIELDFTRHILPHSKAMPGHTVCPGSNFPHAEFEPLVRGYHAAWSTSPEAQQKIASFGQLKYIHA
jgi:N-acetyl-anhydromuramyl-L-alanine amidase AmpD